MFGRKSRAKRLKEQTGSNSLVPLATLSAAYAGAKPLAERLARLGMPSESASNRAERARREVEAGLAALRTSLVESLGTSEGGGAFDREVERRYPSFALPGSDF